MKRFITLLIILSLMGIWWGRSFGQSVQFYPPVKLTINRLNIQASIEPVGLDSEDKMDVPKKVEDVAWYKLGSKAGGKGSVVLAGHFDDKYGAPAVFYNLNQLNKGDEIVVEDEKGKIWTYIVQNKAIYDFDKLPLTEIFASQDKSRLNLITCDGVFDQVGKNYSKRLVVFSELDNRAKPP